MSRKPDFLRRYFILSFQTTDYGRELRNAISFLVTDILTATDSLVLVSPLKNIRIECHRRQGTGAQRYRKPSQKGLFRIQNQT